jgi:hypothetical protein
MSTLREKLDRIHALARGAKTEGERQAALAAAERVARRLTEGDGPGLDLDDDGWDDDFGLDTDEALPSNAQIAAIVQAWLDGERTIDEVCAWAESVVDAMLLPELPVDDPASIGVEALLQLSTLESQPLVEADLPHLLAFLSAEPDARTAWRRWFAYVETANWRARMCQAC